MRVILESNNKGLLNGVSSALTDQAGIDPEKYRVVDVEDKHDGNGYWLDLTAALDCSVKAELVGLCRGYMDGSIPLPNNVTKVNVTDLQDEGYLAPPEV